MGVRENLLRKIEEEISPLERELKVELPRQLAEAAAHGDLSENAEYEAAKQRKGLVEAQLALLYKKKSALSAINPEMISRDSVGFWSTVQLLDVDSGDEITYKLVVAGDADPANGKISLTSPIGRALFGRREGEEVVADTPRGTKTYEVLAFTTIHEDSEPV